MEVEGRFGKGPHIEPPAASENPRAFQTSWVHTIAKVILAVTATSPLLAQAWLFPKGEGTVTLSYQHSYLALHVYSKGETSDKGPIHLNSVLMDVDYSLTGKLAVRVGLPYIAGKYEGPSPHQLPIDDGTYHGTLQDFRTDVRYTLSRRPLMLTPFFQLVIPSHAYEHYAHSTIGFGLREYRVGMNFGRRLDPVLPNAFFQGRYTYIVAQSVNGLSANNADLLRFANLNLPASQPADSFRPRRSDTEFQVGYFLTPRLTLFALGGWLHPHNGIDNVEGVFPNNLTQSQLFNHDRISRLSLVDLGGGASLAVTKSMDAFANGLTTVRARNGHKLAAAVTVGVSWRFRTPWAEIPEASSPASPGSSR